MIHICIATKLFIWFISMGLHRCHFKKRHDADSAAPAGGVRQLVFPSTSFFLITLFFSHSFSPIRFVLFLNVFLRWRLLYLKKNPIIPWTMEQPPQSYSGVYSRLLGVQLWNRWFFSSTESAGNTLRTIYNRFDLSWRKNCFLRGFFYA